MGRPGGSLAAALSSIGVETGTVTTVSASVHGPWGGGDGQTSQLRTDIQALQTELASLAAKSSVTVADLTSLAADSQAIAQAGARIDVKSLDSAVNELATAIVGGTSTTQAQTDFAAVFANTSVSQTTITQAFTDLSKAITDSGVTSTDLATVAKDQAAIQSDLSNLQSGSGGSGRTGSTSGGNCGGSSSGSGIGSLTGGTSSGGSSSSPWQPRPVTAAPPAPGPPRRHSRPPRPALPAILQRRARPARPSARPAIRRIRP